MAVFSKQFLSQSISGRPIPIPSEGGSGDLIHQTGTEGVIDEVWLYMSNHSSSDSEVTVILNPTIPADGELILTIPSKAGLVLVLPGIPMTTNQNGPMTIRAYSSVPGSIMATGYVNRIE